MRALQWPAAHKMLPVAQGEDGAAAQAVLVFQARLLSQQRQSAGLRNNNNHGVPMSKIVAMAGTK